MNSIMEKQNQILNQCNALLQLIDNKLPDAYYRDTLVDLVTDLKKYEHLVTVLGEFKRGKSTLINALIREQLLPSDVTPTTATINVIKHNHHKGIKVFMQNGVEIDHEVSHDKLLNYTFEAGENMQDVHHIDINLDISHLDDKLVLVDTPGVGDLNEHRLDVTYSYIPRSNIIIFVFDVTTPIRKTELDYLQETVLKLKFGEVIFVANFIDRLDEDELEETLEYMEARLKKIMKEEPFSIFPLSSKDALNDPNDHDFTRLVNYLKKQLAAGSASQTKLSFYERRFTQLYRLVEIDIENIEKVRQSSDEELVSSYERLNTFQKEQVKNKESLQHYITDRQQEIIALSLKSIDHFHNELKEYIHEQILMYEGPKFKSFIENTLPIMMKNRLKGWVNSYSPQIEKLISKLDHEIVDGFNVLFLKEMGSLRTSNTAYQIDGKGLALIQPKSGSSDTSVTSGLVVAGAGTIMMLLTGGMLLPIITMAGFPFFNKILAEKKLEKLKAEVTPHINLEVDKLIEKLKYATKQYILAEIKHLEEKATLRYEENVKALVRTIETEILRRKNTNEKELPTIEMNDLLLIKQ